MVLTVTTESGSVYVIDTVAQTWERKTKGHLLPPSPFPLRTTSGTYLHIEDIEVGKRATIYGVGLELGTRFIHTSKIVDIT